MKFLCLLILVLISCRITAQSPSVPSAYQRVIVIDTNSSLSDDAKLQLLHSLKKEFDLQKKTPDTGYVAALVKIALYEYLSNLNGAIQHSLQAARINETLPHPSRFLSINNTYNLASYYNIAMMQSRALNMYDTVISLCRQNDPDDYIIVSRFRKADIYSSLGDHQKVIDECTLGINEALARKDSTYYGYLLNHRADAYLARSDISSALADINIAVSYEEKSGDKYSLATSFAKKAQAYDTLGAYLDAEKYLRKAIQTCPKDGNSKTIAVYYNNLANLYAFKLNRFAKAKKNYMVAIRLSDDCLSQDKCLLSFMAYTNLGEACRVQNRLQEALTYYTIACRKMNIATPNFLFDNVPVNRLSTIEYKDVLFNLLFGKIKFLLQLYAETKQHSYLDACLSTGLLTDSLITKTRFENISEQSKLYWRNKTRTFFDDMVEACYLAKDNEKAYHFMEKSRAVLLIDQVNDLQSSDSYLPEKEMAYQSALQMQIISQQQRLSLLSPQAPDYNAARNSLLTTKDKLEHYIKSLEKRYPAYYNNKYIDSIPPLPYLQTYLGRYKETLVYYFVNDSALYALAICKSKTKLIKVPAKEFDANDLSSFIRFCSNRSVLNNSYNKFATLSHHIYNSIFKPLEIGKGNVAICTDNFFIPFEALNADSRGKHFLIQDYQFSYVYSARSLVKQIAKEPASGNFAGFAPVSFSNSLSVANLAQSASALEKAAGFYNSRMLYTGEQSTRRNFLEQASRYSVLTVFSHAKADTSGVEPVLFMCDSVIHLSELQYLKNPAVQFVLLSACQTNSGRNATGEGIYSLARGFALIGVPSVAATLWKADETATYLISTKFNEYLAEGMRKDEALNKAKIWYLNNDNSTENKLPYYWANMVLIGSTEPVVLSHSYQTEIWSGVISILFILFGLGLYFLQKNKAGKKHSKGKSQPSVFPPHKHSV